MRASAANAKAAKLISADQNVCQVILNHKVKQGFTGRGVRPSIFVATLYVQPSFLSRLTKGFVVVGVAATAILNAVHVVVIVNHFVEQGRAHILNGSCKCSCANVDFMRATQLGNPRIIIQGEMPIGSWRGLNGDGWS